MAANPPPPPPPPPPAGEWPPAPPGWAGSPPAPPPGWAASGWNGPAGYGPPPGWGWAGKPALPGSGRFRAQAVGELLDSAFTLYRRNIRLILAITAMAQIPLAVFDYLAYQLTGFTGASARLQQLSNGAPITREQLNSLTAPLLTILLVSAAVLLVQALVVQPIATAAMTRAVADIYLDQPASVGGAYSAVGHRIGAIVGVTALLFLAGLGLFAVIGAVALAAVLALGQSGLALLIVLLPAGAFLLIVVYTRWLFAAPIVILERLGPVAALRRSWALVRGSTPRVFGITLLVGLITGILSAVVAALLSVATQFGDPNLHLVLTQLAQLVVSVLIQPISFIVVVLLYYDLRIRREAFDIEMLAATL